MTKLFLDDVRTPSHCMSYMPSRIGSSSKVYQSADWVIVRTHDEFVNWIEKNGLPNLISFDHDLSYEHYSQNMYTSEDQYEADIKGSPPTGYDSALWLIKYCSYNKKPLPMWIVHSMNPIGASRIENALKNFKKYEK